MSDVLVPLDRTNLSREIDILVMRRLGDARRPSALCLPLLTESQPPGTDPFAGVIADELAVVLRRMRRVPIP